MTSLPLPDTLAHPADLHSPPLDWVGMCGVAARVRLHHESLLAKIDAGVDLIAPGARGIHMSRLYLALAELEEGELDRPRLERLLAGFLDSHRGLASRASVTIRTELPLSRPALVSPIQGWKGYPVEVWASLDAAGLRWGLNLTLAYSSTCPCSAALARQLIQRGFEQAFAERMPSRGELLDWLGSARGIAATPHSQRSEASLRVRLSASTTQLPLLALLEAAEAALGTAVQTAVKRVDEQAFALANGQNTMFCEDAARRLYGALRPLPALEGFRVRVVHAESLHAHDAVAELGWRWPA